LKRLNEGLSLLIELSIMAAVAFFGFTYFSDALSKWVFGLGVPLALIAAWGILLAPKSPRRLKIAPGLALSSALFVAASLLLIVGGQAAIGFVLLLASLINRFLAFRWKQW
jgi:hypothetical protein